MLKRFSVKNFKNFKNELVLDLSKVRDYEFNKELISNGLVNKMLIYGPNNSGKSNLGAAIMDITTHLTDNNANNLLYVCYINGDFTDDVIDFKYEFLFDNVDVIYSYRKDAQRRLLSEEMYSNGVLLFKYNYVTEQFDNNIQELKTIDIKKRNTGISVLKYIYNNSFFWEDNSPIKLVMEFVNNMLWFRSLKSNEFMGVMSNGEDLSDFIINNRLTADFQNFLKNCGQDYKLCEIYEAGRKVLGVQYRNYSAKFELVASTGMLSLWLFFYWMNRTNNISFVFLDEFDAFYNYELSTYILRFVNEKHDFQSILTSHNTYLISNELMRPDCYAILDGGKITSFADSTKKTIRQGHNLEKMMLGGEFES